MSWTLVLSLSFLCLSPGSVITASSRVQMADIKILERSQNGQCSSIKERESARIEIHQLVVSAITSTLANTTQLASTTNMPPTTTISTTASTTIMPTTTATTVMPTTASTIIMPTTTAMTVMPTTASTTIMPTATAMTTMSTTTSTTTLPTTTAMTTMSTTASTTTMPTTTAMTTMSTMITCSGPRWRRIAFINMTNTSYSCPTGLSMTSYSKRTCGRSHTNAGCSSTTFSTGDLSYSKVYGRIEGYQFGAAGAFYRGSKGIDSYYVDGVSLTHGGDGRRQHIWTFAAGATEVNQGSNFAEDCPCDISHFENVPTFVGNDYFCESGLHSAWNLSIHLNTFFPDDVLWDGQGCTSTSTCCQLNNPPWFTKSLPIATLDDIELRLCTNSGPTIDDVPIELIELYVQ